MRREDLDDDEVLSDEASPKIHVSQSLLGVGEQRAADATTLVTSSAADATMLVTSSATDTDADDDFYNIDVGDEESDGEVAAAGGDVEQGEKKKGIRQKLSELTLKNGRIITVEQVEDLAELHLQRRKALAARSSKSLYAQAQNYWKLLLLIGLFYFIPAFEFVLWEFRLSAQLGFDTPDHECFFNFKCANSMLGFYSFNNIVSNGFYVLVGGALALGIYVDRSRVRSCALGLDCDASLYYATAFAIVFQGVFSATYHVCPSGVNFQFDTTFMVITCALFLMGQYAKRHGPLVPSAFRAYSSMLLFVVLSLLSLVRWLPSPVFWGLTACLSVYLNLHVSTVLYHPISSKTPRERLLEFWQRLRAGQGPKQKKRFAFFVFCVLVNLLLSIIPLSYPALDRQQGGDVDTRSFPVFVLGIFVISWIIYFFYYLFMKTIRTHEQEDEAVPLVSLLAITVSVVLWIVGVYFFRIPTANKFLTWEESRLLNAECVLFGYFDTHDIWHMCSACALGFQLLATYTVDRNLRDCPRSKILVF